jgi:hypothetical protein
MASPYHVSECTVNSTVPVNGRFLAHNHLDITDVPFWQPISFLASSGLPTC